MIKTNLRPEWLEMEAVQHEKDALSAQRMGDEDGARNARKWGKVALIAAHALRWHGLTHPIRDDGHEWPNEKLERESACSVAYEDLITILASCREVSL